MTFYCRLVWVADIQTNAFCRLNYNRRRIRIFVINCCDLDCLSVITSCLFHYTPSLSLPLVFVFSRERQCAAFDNFNRAPLNCFARPNIASRLTRIYQNSGVKRQSDRYSHSARGISMNSTCRSRNRRFFLFQFFAFYFKLH